MNLKSIIQTIKSWIIENQKDIILVIGVVLMCLLSFALGYISANQQIEKEQIIFEDTGK